jgi:hypothetical protein
MKALSPDAIGIGGCPCAVSRQGNDGRAEGVQEPVHFVMNALSGSHDKAFGEGSRRNEQFVGLPDGV